MTINILISIVTGLVSGFILHLWLNREHDTTVRVKVFDPSDSNQSSNYYALYSKAVFAAKDEIIQFGEGFSTDLPERLEKAKAFADQIRQKLRTDPAVKWIRVQTRHPLDKQWFNLLQGLQRDFPAQFKFFLINNRVGDHVASVVLVDPQSKHGQSFILISKPNNLGGESAVNVAYTGVMLAGSRIFAQALSDRLNQLRDPHSGHGRQISPSESFEETMQSMESAAPH